MRREKIKRVEWRIPPRPKFKESNGESLLDQNLKELNGDSLLGQK
jgi:hypothetical protein